MNNFMRHTFNTKIQSVDDDHQLVEIGKNNEALALFDSKNYNLIKVIPNQDYRIVISESALENMYHIVDLADQEIGWLGIVDRVNNDFIINDIYIPEQEVHATTTEISAKGVADTVMELINAGLVDKVNKLRFWGHSHVRMGTSPSYQDEKQFEELSGNCDDFFIRGIANKNGRIQFSIHLISEGIIIDDIEWVLENTTSDLLRNSIEETIKSKVCKKTYSRPNIFKGGKSYPTIKKNTKKQWWQTEDYGWYDEDANYGYEDYSSYSKNDDKEEDEGGNDYDALSGYDEA